MLGTVICSTFEEGKEATGSCRKRPGSQPVQSQFPSEGQKIILYFFFIRSFKIRFPSFFSFLPLLHHAFHFLLFLSSLLPSVFSFLSTTPFLFSPSSPFLPPFFLFFSPPLFFSVTFFLHSLHPSLPLPFPPSLFIGRWRPCPPLCTLKLSHGKCQLHLALASNSLVFGKGKRRVNTKMRGRTRVFARFRR